MSKPLCVCLALLLVIAAGCRLVDQPDLDRARIEVLPLNAGSEPGVDEIVRSREVLVIADNQFRYDGGKGVPMTAAIVDSFVPTAARPIVLNMFATDVFRWAVSRRGKQPVIHLGDACDISCVFEFTWFVDSLRENGAPWVMAPGNHDCAFMGSAYQENWELEGRNWFAACEGGGGEMDKAAFVALYLAAMWDQIKDEPGSDQLAQALGSSRVELLRDLPAPGALSERLVQLAARIRPLAPHGSWTRPAGEALLTGLNWAIDEEHPWRSYVVQRVALSDPAGAPGPGFTGIVLDTCQWWHMPQLIPINIVPPWEWNPGLRAELLADQLVAIKAWMDQAASEGDAVTLFGHHPIKEFSPKSQLALEWLWNNYDIITYASGHTHTGFVDIHREYGPGALEINIASITDWPMEWRGLQLTRYRRGEETYFGVTSPRYTVLEELLRENPDLTPSWKAYEEGARRYLAYRVGDDLALGYDVTIQDLLGGSWWKVWTLGTLTWFFLGEDSLARGLYHTAIPNVEGVNREHVARRRLAIQELVRLWDEFPTTGNVETDWQEEEAELRKLSARALQRDSSGDFVEATARRMIVYTLGREVADPAAHSRHRMLLAVWASMYEANVDGQPSVHDNSFRIADDVKTR